MSTAAEPPPPDGRTARRGRRALVAVSVLALAAGAGVWLSRVPIATQVIDRELATRGVPARYHISDLGPGTVSGPDASRTSPFVARACPSNAIVPVRRSTP